MFLLLRDKQRKVQLQRQLNLPFVKVDMKVQQGCNHVYLGKTVRFSDSPGISSRPSKESARSYLNSTLPHTFNINVDHDRYSPKPATNVPSKSVDTAVPVKHVPSAKDINVTNTKPESSKKQDDISASCKGLLDSVFPDVIS